MNSLKKPFSIFLVLMMLISVVPFYASAEAIALTADNVVAWPTTSGEIYFGQKLSDGITLNSENALVTSDGTETGTVIPGKWEFIDKDFAPTAWGKTSKANVKFTPENTDEYIGFEVTKSANVTYVVNKTTPVFVDEINDPIVATDVEQGAKLSTSTLSGGQMKNPYTNEIINKAWKWSSSSTIVNSTGEYKAIFTGGSSYNKLEAMIKVKVIGTMQETEITQAPETAVIEYSPTATFGDVVMVGGKAVIKGTDTEVKGTFSTSWADVKVGNVGSKEIPVTFTPDDTENYIASEGKMTVTVTKGNYKLVNEDGEEVVPEFTMPYGTTFDPGLKLGVALKNMIKDRSSLTGADAPYVSFPDHGTEEKAPVGTNTYTVRINPGHDGNSSYQTTYLQFVLTIEPVVITTTAYWAIGGTIGGKVSHDVQGTVDVFVDGELVGDNIKITRNKDWSFDYPIPATGDYTLKVVYNPIENDPHSMEDYETVVNVRMIRKIILPEDSRVTYKVNGDERTSIMRLGDTIELSTFGGDLFRGWEITDANGNAVDLGVADLMANQITFIMPDHDLYIEAQYEKEVVDDNNGGLDIDNIFGDLDLDNLTQGDSDNPFENLLNNIIALFKNIIEKLTSFFRAIGDKT